MRRKIAGVVAIAAALLTGCDNKPADVEVALSSASSVQSSVMASVAAEESSAVAAADAAREHARDDAFRGTGAPIPAPPDFDPLGTGRIYAGDYVVTATDIEQLRDGYASVGGAAQFELGELAPLPEDRTISIFTDGAAVTLYLPSNVPVRTYCNAIHATADCPTGTVNPQAPGRVLTLKVETRGGNIAVIPWSAMQ